MKHYEKLNHLGATNIRKSTTALRWGVCCHEVGTGVVLMLRTLEIKQLNPESSSRFSSQRAACRFARSKYLFSESARYGKSWERSITHIFGHLYVVQYLNMNERKPFTVIVFHCQIENVRFSQENTTKERSPLP